MSGKTMVMKSMKVLEFTFHANSDTDKKIGKMISSNDKINVTQGFKKIDDSSANVYLRATIGEPNNDGFPFFLSASICGLFELPNYEKDPDDLFYMKNSTISILYPYLRSLVAEISNMSGFTAINLPIINTLQAFGDLTVDEKTQNPKK